MDICSFSAVVEETNLYLVKQKLRKLEITTDPEYAISSGLFFPVHIYVKLRLNL